MVTQNATQKQPSRLRAFRANHPFWAALFMTGMVSVLMVLGVSDAAFLGFDIPGDLVDGVGWMAWIVMFCKMYFGNRELSTPQYQQPPLDMPSPPSRSKRQQPPQNDPVSNAWENRTWH